MDHKTGRYARIAAAAALAAGLLAGQPGSAGAQAPAPSKPAIFHNNIWYLRNSMTTGAANVTFPYGTVGDIPVMGDWDGNGTKTPGVVRPSTDANGDTRYQWYLRNSNTAGVADIGPLTYGRRQFVAVDQLGSIPVAGDWNGDGVDTPGVVQYAPDPAGAITWQLRNTNTTGPADVTLAYGAGRDVPVAGDWNGDGSDNPGVVRSDNWLLSNDLNGGSADVSFFYGSQSITELPVVGDWDGNGTDTPAVLRNVPNSDAEGGFEQWLFRNSNSSGAATGIITFGSDAQSIFQPVEFIPRMSWK